MASIIKTESLVKDFGKIRAVDHLSLEVEEKTIFGFLGPNGAGKTTTINILCTLLRPTSGRSKELIDENTQRAIDILMRIGGVKIEGYPSDISIRIDLLPKVRLLILYSKGDNEFGSSLNILFDKITDEFLDVESLIFLLEGLVHTVRYMFSSRTLE
jgi:energy-coupling factor transporter ATP-binding protein EcfA2